MKTELLLGGLACLLTTLLAIPLAKYILSAYRQHYNVSVPLFI